MNETEEKFYAILFKLLDLLDAPGCFQPDIGEIMKDLGYEATWQDVLFGNYLWQALKEFS